MEVEATLSAFGVARGTLSDGERAILDGEGVLALPGLFSADAVSRLRALTEELVGPAATPSGTRHLDGLLARDAAFARLWCHPRVLAAVAAMVGTDFRAVGVGYRRPLPGFGAQKLHVDWTAAPVGRRYPIGNAILALVDFTVENGATRVVPRSHLWGRSPRDADSDRPHPEERVLTGEAGTVFVFNGHVWHSGTRNRSREVRHSLHALYRARGFRAYEELPPSLPADLSAAERRLAID